MDPILLKAYELAEKDLKNKRQGSVTNAQKVIKALRKAGFTTEARLLVIVMNKSAESIPRKDW